MERTDEEVIIITTTTIVIAAWSLQAMASPRLCRFPAAAVAVVVLLEVVLALAATESSGGTLCCWHWSRGWPGRWASSARQRSAPLKGPASPRR